MPAGERAVGVGGEGGATEVVAQQSGDYFDAMNRVEQHIEIAPLPKLVENTNQEDEVVKEPERTQIVTWLGQLTLPELRQEKRLELMGQFKRALSLKLTR